MIILAVVLAVLVASGIFSGRLFSSQGCIFQNGFDCIDVFMSENGMLQFSMQQSLQHPINVTYIGCDKTSSIANMAAPYNPPTNQIYMPVGVADTFYVQCYGTQGTFSGTPGTQYIGTLIVNYTDEVTGVPYVSFGTVTVTVSSV